MNITHFIDGLRCRNCSGVYLPTGSRCPHCKSLYRGEPVLICPVCEDVRAFSYDSIGASRHSDEHNKEIYLTRLRDGTAPLGEWAMEFERPPIQQQEKTNVTT